MPLVMRHCLDSLLGVKYDTSISQGQYMATNPVGRFTLEKASRLVSMNVGMKIPNISQVKGRVGEDYYYLNTKSNIVNNNSKAANNGEPVTSFRIKVTTLLDNFPTVFSLIILIEGLSNN